MRGRITLALVFSLVFTQTAQASHPDISAASVKPIELSQIATKARIVALANGSAEIVSALGMRSALVGRDIASTAPELVQVPIVTSGHQVIAEKVISLKPTLVLIDSNVGPQSAIDLIKSAKLKVVIIPQAWNIQDIYPKIDQIGKAIGLQKEANLLISKMKKAILKARVSIGWNPKIAFLYLRGTSAIYLIGGPGSGADSLVSEFGGVDVGAKTLKNPFNTLTSEALIKANPDVILLMTNGLKSVGGENGLFKLPGISQTSAGRSKRILSVDDSLLLSFGPRTPALLIKMAEALQDMK